MGGVNVRQSGLQVSLPVSREGYFWPETRGPLPPKAMPDVP